MVLELLLPEVNVRRIRGIISGVAREVGLLETACVFTESKEGASYRCFVSVTWGWALQIAEKGLIRN